MTIESLRRMLMESHVGTLKLIGVDFKSDDSVYEVHVEYAVRVMDFMDYCGVRGSMTSNWHNLLYAQIGPKYDESIISVTKLTAWWASQHKCTGVEHFAGKFPSVIDGRVKVISLGAALLMGCDIGTENSKRKFAQM